MNRSGTVIAAGALSADNNWAGAVMVFEWDGTNWVKKGNTIEGVNSERSGHYDTSINNTGDILIVSGYSYPTPSSTRGRIRVFKYNSVLNIWDQIDSDIFGSTTSNSFGVFTDMNSLGNKFVVGDYGSSELFVYSLDVPLL